MATMWYGQYDLVGAAFVTFANVGHPPPLLFDADRDADFLDGPVGPPLGAGRYVTYRDDQRVLEPGTAFLLYTDGLIEQRHESIDVGMQRLRDHVVRGPRDLERLCDHLVGELADGPHVDDIVLLAIQPVGVSGRELHLLRRSSSDAIPETRHVLRSWLQQNAVSPDDTFDILLATTEAYTNSVRHAYGLAQGTVEIEARLTRDRFEVAVRDRGTWKSGASRTKGDESRGITIMQKLMDDVQIHSDAQGTQTRMRRALKVPIPHE